MSKTKSKTKSSKREVRIVRFIARDDATNAKVEREVRIIITDAMIDAPSLIVDAARAKLGALVERCNSIIWKTGSSTSITRNAYRAAVNAGPDEE